MRRLYWLLIALLLSGCETLAYYGQSIGGHLNLMAKQAPLQEAVVDTRLSSKVRSNLSQVKAMRDFALDQLGIKDNGSYLTFVDVGREAVVWSVVATPELSLIPQQWCYPIIGCASYRGYFAKEDAQAYVAGLEAQNMDVAVLAVPAYSTLGWFADPLPSTVASWSSYRVAALIFHEFAHQALYAEDDSAFNESFATVIEQALLLQWLNTVDQQSITQWQKSEAREKDFDELLFALRNKLDAIYSSASQDEDKRRNKEAAFSELRFEYFELKQQWNGYSGYDRWMSQDLNNAHLAGINLYRQWVPALHHLLDKHGGDIKAFVNACKMLADLPVDQRLERLMALQAELSST